MEMLPTASAEEVSAEVVSAVSIPAAWATLPWEAAEAVVAADLALATMVAIKAEVVAPAETSRAHKSPYRKT